MSDSSFFLEQHTYLNQEKWVFETMNSASGVNQECIKAQTTDDRWKCMLSEHNALFLRTPTFLLQPVFDMYVYYFMLGMTDEAKINELGNNVRKLVQEKLIDSNPKNGAFLDSCPHHCGGFGTYHVQGKTAPVAFQEWYEERASKQVYEQGESYPCTNCCNAPGN
jgi:hypothetical protein